MLYYEFPVTLGGQGDNVEDAWLNALDNFCSDPGVAPDPAVYTDDGELVSDGLDLPFAASIRTELPETAELECSTCGRNDVVTPHGVDPRCYRHVEGR